MRDVEKPATKSPFVQFFVMKNAGLCCCAMFGLAACDAAPRCSSTLLQVARDLGSDRYAATSVRNCGATTQDATVVHVGRASEPPSAAREVFVSDTGHGTATSVSGNAVWTSVVWTGPGRLSIAHASKARIFKRLPDAQGAPIRYIASDPLTSPHDIIVSEPFDLSPAP